MLIYLRSYGQLCNRLWSILPALSLSMERKEKLHILFNNPNDIKLFPNIEKCENLHVVTNRDYRIISSALYRLLNFMNPNSDLSTLGSRDHKIYVINSWKHIYDHSFITKYKEDILRIFSFNASTEEKVSRFFENFHGVTVGVHVRRGDYKSWRKGHYYFNDIVYIKKMECIRKQLIAEGIDCRFIICSNEPFEATDTELPITRIPNASGIEDLCALSKCDYILGPPSSFSQWASFVGNVPLAFLMDEDQELLLSDFNPIERMNVFTNSKKLIDVNGVEFKIE